MDKFEKLVLEIMQEAEADGEPVTREEAEEMARMEIGAKSERHYEQAETKKERKPRERKVDEDKKLILSVVRTLLQGFLLNRNQADTTAVKNEAELTFSFNGNDYTFKLIKHRRK